MNIHYIISGIAYEETTDSSSNMLMSTSRCIALLDLWFSLCLMVSTCQPCQHVSARSNFLRTCFRFLKHWLPCHKKCPSARQSCNTPEVKQKIRQNSFISKTDQNSARLNHHPMLDKCRNKEIWSIVTLHQPGPIINHHMSSHDKAMHVD